MTFKNHDRNIMLQKLNGNKYKYNFLFHEYSPLEKKIIDKIKIIVANPNHNNELNDKLFSNHQLIQEFGKFFLKRFPELFCPECLKYVENSIDDFIDKRKIIQYYFPLYELCYYNHHNRLLNYKLIHELNKVLSINDSKNMDENISHFTLKSYYKFLSLLKKMLQKDENFFRFNNNNILILHQNLKEKFEKYIEDHKQYSSLIFKEISNIQEKQKRIFFKLFPVFTQFIFLDECKKNIQDMTIYNNNTFDETMVQEIFEVSKKIPLFHNKVIIRLKSLKGLPLALISIYNDELYKKILIKNKSYSLFDQYVIQASKNILQRYEKKLLQYFKLY